MKLGYVRVSTVEQNESRQLETMKLYGVEKIFSEKISAKIKIPNALNLMNFSILQEKAIPSIFMTLAALQEIPKTY